MAGAPPPPIDPTDLFEDFGHYGTVTSVPFEYLGVQVDRLGACAHRLRCFNLWDARQHADAAFEAMPEHPPCAFFTALTDGAFPYGTRDRWEDALASLRRHAPAWNASTAVLEALAHIAATDQASFARSRESAAREGVHPATIAALEAINIARTADDFEKAGASILAHIDALGLEHRTPFDAAAELYARWGRRTHDRHAFEKGAGALAAKYPTDTRLALERARNALAFHDGASAHTTLTALAGSGVTLTPELRGAQGRAKLICLGANDAMPDLDAAIDGAGDASTIDRDDRVEWLLARSTAHTSQQKQIAAERDASEAIRIAPRRASSYVRRAQLRAQLMKPVAAADDLEAALRLQPMDCPDTLLGDLASHWFNARRYDKAIPAFERALRDGQRRNYDVNRRAHLEDFRGAALHFVGRFEEAVVAYSRAIALVQSNGKPFSDRGEALLELGRDEAAFADLERAVELGYRASCTYVGRGTYFQRKSDHVRAIAEFDEAARLAPTSPQPLELRARCYEATGDMRRANDDRERAAVLRATRR